MTCSSDHSRTRRCQWAEENDIFIFQSAAFTLPLHACAENRVGLLFVPDTAAAHWPTRERDIRRIPHTPLLPFTYLVPLEIRACACGPSNYFYLANGWMAPSTGWLHSLDGVYYWHRWLLLLNFATMALAGSWAC